MGDAADGDDGNGHGLTGVPNPLRPLHRLGIPLRGGRENGAKPNVVGSSLVRLNDLLRFRGRGPDEGFRAQDGTGLVHREVLLAEVHPVGVDGLCYVNPVVDDEGS
jgi:hypothetical protein